MPSLDDAFVAQLEDENEELRERIQQLEDLLGMTLDIPLVLGLTASEARVLGFLMKSEIATKEAIMLALYSRRPPGDIDPEIKIVDVYVCKIRKKLDKFASNIVIETVWGRGYRMSAESKRHLTGMLKQELVNEEAHVATA